MEIVALGGSDVLLLIVLLMFAVLVILVIVFHILVMLIFLLFVCRGGGRCNWWLRSAGAGSYILVSLVANLGMIAGNQVKGAGHYVPLWRSLRLVVPKCWFW
jgi:hypothetical protein